MRKDWVDYLLLGVTWLMVLVIIFVLAEYYYECWQIMKMPFSAVHQ